MHTPHTFQIIYYIYTCGICRHGLSICCGGKKYTLGVCLRRKHMSGLARQKPNFQISRMTNSRNYYNTMVYIQKQKQSPHNDNVTAPKTCGGDRCRARTRRRRHSDDVFDDRNRRNFTVPACFARDISCGDQRFQNVSRPPKLANENNNNNNILCVLTKIQRNFKTKKHKIAIDVFNLSIRLTLFLYTKCK